MAAEQRALEFDDFFWRTGQLVGPLHGLPVSLKDRYISQLQRLGFTASREVRRAIDASGDTPVHQLSRCYDNDDVEP